MVKEILVVLFGQKAMVLIFRRLEKIRFIKKLQPGLMQGFTFFWQFFLNRLLIGTCPCLGIKISHMLNVMLLQV